MGILAGALPRLLATLASLLGAAVSAGAQTQATPPAPVRIGVLTALSGSYVPFGQPLYDGVKLAIDEINASGGLEVGGTKRPVELVQRDTRSDVNTTVAGTTALVRDDRLKFVIGPATGIETAAALEITQRAKVIQLSAASILQGVLNKTNTAPGGNRYHLFMVQASSDVRERLTIKASAQYLGNPKTHAVIISNDSNGDFIGKRVVEAIENSGAKLALPMVLYEPGTTDYSPYLTKIRSARPDHLNIWWLPTDGVNILLQAEQLKAASSYFVFGIEPADVTQRLGAKVDRVLIACSPICRSATTTPASKEFWDQYSKLLGAERKFGAAAGGAAWYYEGARMLFRAIQQAGTADDTDKIAQILAGMKSSGALGEITFDERHVLVHGYDFCLFSSGAQKCEYVSP